MSSELDGNASKLSWQIGNASLDETDLCFRRLCVNVHGDLEDDRLPGSHRLSNVRIDSVVIPKIVSNINKLWETIVLVKINLNLGTFDLLTFIRCTFFHSA